MLTFVVPMAGHGSRFAREGYTLPKPLIPVHGVPMVRLVIDNLATRLPHRFVFVVRAEHVAEHRLDERLRAWAPGCTVVTVDGVTGGAAQTVLLAAEHVADDDVLVVANSDQWVDARVDDWVAPLLVDDRDPSAADGLLLTMTADDPKWSFVERDASGAVTRVVEKVVVSDEATVGVYGYRRAGDFVAAASAMIAADERVNGEFYVAPAYDRMVAAGARLTTYSVGTVGAGMHGLGVPEDLAAFLALPWTRALARRAAGTTSAAPAVPAPWGAAPTERAATSTGAPC